MNALVFKYLGLKNQQYIFMDEANKIVAFSKCRKDLIESFKLNEHQPINQWFLVSFFKTRPLNPNDLNEGVGIISDMKIIQH